MVQCGSTRVSVAHIAFFMASVWSAAGDSLPHLVFILVDDFGWADAGWHRADGYREVQTPHMDQLVAEGIELDRNYAYKFW